MLPSSIWTLLSLAGLASQVCAQNATNQAAQDATVFALTYGYPLLAYEKIRILVNVTGVNKWYHFRSLQTPANKAVVKPNVDTLYSAMVYDLSHDDLLVSIPDGIPEDQFVLISFFDPFGTNYVNIGTNQTDTPGIYRLQPRVATATPDISSGSQTSAVATLKTNSMYGFLLIRWLVNNTNLDALHMWQDQTVNRTEVTTARAPALASLPVFDASRTPADNVLRLLTAFAPHTLPDDTTQAESVTASLTAAGTSNGSYTAPSGINLMAANSTAVSNAVDSAAAPSAKIVLSNGWTTANSSLIGVYGDNYAFRAAVASGGYLALRAPEAIYPSWSNGSSSTPLGGTLMLGANESLLLTFASTPPLSQAGFWSVTAYQNNFLIDNRYNVYAITSERSNITYADGTTVNSSSTVSRPYQLLVQPADVIPPSNWTNNFLPGPPGGGEMELTFRLYLAEQSLLDGDWQYPVITRQAAFRAGNSTSNGTIGGTTPTASTSSAKPTNSASGTSATPAVHTGLGNSLLSPTWLVSVPAVLMSVFAVGDILSL